MVGQLCNVSFAGIIETGLGVPRMWSSGTLQPRVCLQVWVWLWCDILLPMLLRASALQADREFGDDSPCDGRDIGLHAGLHGVG